MFPPPRFIVVGQSSPIKMISVFLEPVKWREYHIFCYTMNFSVRLVSFTNPSLLVHRSREKDMTSTSPEQNKQLVLEAFDTLFNKRDYVAAERFWSDRYIQHSAHIPPGRDGLFNLVRGLPDTLRYENHLILGEGNYVIAHGRFSGHGRPAAWIAADVVRFEDGKLAEHWDVLQDEASQAESVSGLPMFGARFPA
jgi:predicted SnoaL-like aldol condensation-catalyzing enzyme